MVNRLEASNGNSGPTYSRGTGRGIEVDAAQSVVDGIASRWANAPEVVVVADLQDAKVPERVRNVDAEQRSQGATGEPEGFWYGGKAYIVASAINSPQDAAQACPRDCQRATEAIPKGNLPKRMPKIPDGQEKAASVGGFGWCAAQGGREP